MQKLIKTTYLKFFTALILYALIFLATNLIAIAATDIVPDPDDFTPNTDDGSIKLVTSVEGSTIRLQAPVTWTRVTFANLTGDKQIRILNGCLGGSYGDYTSNSNCDKDKVQFSVYYLDEAGDKEGSSDLSTGKCKDISDSELTNGWSDAIGVKSCLRSYTHNAATGQQLYGALIMSRLTDSNSINGFKIRAITDNGFAFAGYADTNVSHVNVPTALLRLPMDSDGENDYSIKMRKTCRQTDKTPLRLRWQDADSGPEGQPQDGNVHFRVEIWRERRQRADGTWVDSNPATDTPTRTFNSQGIYDNFGYSNEDNFLGGQDAKRDIEFDGSGNRPLFNIYRGDYIRWTWYNVDRNNGVQLFLYYDNNFYNVKGEDYDCNKDNNDSPAEAQAYVDSNPSNAIEPNEIGRLSPRIEITTKASLTGHTADYKLTMTKTSVLGESPADSCVDASGTFSLDNVTTISNPPNNCEFTAQNVGDQVCMKLEVIGNDWVGASEDRECITVVSRPVVKFKGADVMTCDATAGTYTWAKSLGGYSGSSAQYAAIIQSIIDGATGDNPDDKQGFFTAGGPKPLTFANDLATAHYGGNFSGGMTCDNLYSPPTGAVITTPSSPHLLVPSGLPDPDPANPDPAKRRIISDGSISNTDTPPIQYINGNVYITAPITYAGQGNWTNRSQIPRFELRVNGNIYIAPGVGQLDGFYYATGDIYTCYQAGWTKPDYSTCRTKLTVNGAMYANNSIKYWRTSPTLNTGGIAEEFILSPEIYLSQQGEATGGLYFGPYNYIKSAPPIF